MSTTFRRMTPDDASAVTAFLASNRFPFHVNTAPDEFQANKRVAEGHFWSKESQGYWVQHGGKDIGLVVLEDLEDDNPVFDLRLAESQRGRGLGVEVVRALCRLAFTELPDIVRFEGQTREDNIAMRKTFLRAGFVKEAHYRQAWPTADGTRLASVAYAILRSDWENNTVTPLEFDDLLLDA
ncbi:MULTISPECIES: GNAT family N-acetyltransferase [unclassified Arthrobacter]|uniref:GNAT family N-acetyltransferase n=1 Tax=unclassified Arthrobacter TaxID=235627 RepID=UPI0021023E25|nr:MULTISPECIES: GNAT family protein [unclassified Arthrobacter]MCQ1985932.1 GNAT family N-acetyltransferase [Arthrobacter sp. zg-Y844]MCQ1994326.1 GNAT family N-acetyltransferase [Arthrobacter sp. zg-Y1171]UWX81583.1 GNAT family N-acetyltransferase [Arthrobacter sp. zg-Y1171]